jgi:WASH complex subunit 7
MVRSGGLHYVSQSIKFVPELTERVVFEEEVKEEGLSEVTVLSARCLDDVLKDLNKKFSSEKNHYFHLLINIFKPVLITPEQKHLMNFYLIVPSLMLSYIDNIKQMKEKINKQTGRQEISFTDDGFVLGVAYLLSVLELDGLFDSLHWFDSVKLYIVQKKND